LFGGIQWRVYKTQIDFIILPFPEQSFLNHKSQNSNPKQIPITKIQNLKRFEHWIFEFGIYLLFGYCNLVL
jgi:hypothetical protein